MKNQFDKLLSLKRLKYLLCIGLFMIAASNSYADHFRYGNISWQRVPGNPYAIKLKITMAFKRTFFANPNNIIVGSTKAIGGMFFGDGGSQAVNLTVTAVNAKEDWFYGEFSTTHTYPSVNAEYTAAYTAGAGRLGAPLLLNNASGNIAVNTRVQVGTAGANDAPVSVIPPFINFPVNQTLVSYQIPALDPNGDPVTFSLTPNDSFGIGCSQPSGLAISPTGLLTWNTIGKTVGQLYNTSIKVKDSKGAYISLDVLIRMVTPSPPATFDNTSGPADGSTIEVQPGDSIVFNVKANGTPGDTVKLTAYGLPPGAVFNTSGYNPIIGTFTWKPDPTQEGDFLVNFVSEDTAGVQSSTSVNLSVSFKPRFNIPTTPGNNSIFTGQPGSLIQHPVVAYHPDVPDLVTLTATGTKPGMAFFPPFPITAANPVGTTFQWTPATSDWGLNRMAFKATDNFFGESAYDTIYYLIDTPPVITSSPKLYAYADSAYSYMLCAYDVDTPYGDKLKLEIATIPSFLSSSNVGTRNWNIAGTPTAANIGTYTLTFEVADSLNHLMGTHAGNATQTYILKVLPKLVLTGVAANATIYGAANGSVDITPAGGEGPYTYNWSNGATTEDLTGVVAGTYTVTVTDAHGAKITNTFTVTEPAPLVVTGTVTNVGIFGQNTGAVDITVTGGVGAYTYNWSNSATTQDLSNIGAATYNVTVTDANGATATGTFTVTQPAQLVVNGLTTDVTIFGQTTGAVDITVMGGVGPYSYIWSNSAVTEDLANVGAAAYTVNVTDANGATATGTFTVTQPAQLNVAGTVTDVTIYGNSNGAVDITVTGGVGPYTYNWSNSTSNEDITGVGAGTYTVTVTDANGAVKTANFTVNQPAVLAATGVTTDATIFGSSNGTIDLTVTGGVGPYAYTWSNGSHNEDLSGLAAGTYTVTITDIKGAVKTATFTVNQPAALAVSGIVNNVTIFGGSNGAVDATVTGGVGPYTYTWSNGSHNEDLSNLTAGTYTVTVTDANGATKTASFTVTQPAQLLATAGITNATIFGNTNGAVDITVTGGVGPYSYTWSNGSHNEDLTGVGAGTYTVTITDANGAVFSATYTVTQPAQLLVNGVVNNVTIFGGSNGAVNITVTGGVGPYTYSWSNSAITEDISGVVAGIYTVTVTDANGAVKTASFTVAQPAVLGVTGVVTDATIFGSSNGAINITVTGGVGPYAYTWSNGSHNEDLSNLAAGTYTVIVTDANGATKTVTFTIGQPAALAIAGVISNVTIYGNSNGAVDITVTGGVGPYSYTWSNGSHNEDLVNVIAGVYTVMVTDANGAIKSATFTVNQPAQLAVSGVATNVTIFGGSNGAVDATVTGGVGPYSYTWSNGAHTEDISGVVAGTYTINVTDANGATANSTFTITQPAALAVSGVVTDVTVFGNSNGAVNITVTGGVGPYAYTWSNGAHTEDLNGVPAGTYTVAITDANGATKTAGFTVNQPAPLAATGVVTNVTIYGGNNGAIDLTVTGGVGPYAYTWSNGSHNQDLTGLAAGMYTVTITDANGATQTASFTITQPAPLAATAVVTNVTTYGGNNGAIDLTVTGGVGPYAYTWSNGSHNQDLTNLTAGTYTVTVTDANGATKTATFTVTQPSNMAVTVSVSPVYTVAGQAPYTIYDGYGPQSVTLTANVTGGVAPFTYSWSPASTLTGATTSHPVAAPQVTTTYTVTVTDANGTVKTATQTINVVDVNCGNNKVSICHRTQSCNSWHTHNYYCYSYNTLCVSSNAVAAHLAHGDYLGQCLDVSGNATDVACKGGNTGAINLTVTGGVPPYTYSWSNNATTQNISGLVAGTYTVTVTAADGRMVTQAFTVNQPSSALTVTGVVANACYGSNNGSINQTVTGGNSPYKYLWNNNSTSQDRSNLSAGTYSVVVTDDNGCAVSKSYTVTQPSSAIAISGVVANVSCNGDDNGGIDITVTGGAGPYTYSWDDNSNNNSNHNHNCHNWWSGWCGSHCNNSSGVGTTQDLSNVEAGVYTVTVTDANGCTKTASFTITEPATPVSATGTVSNSCAGASNGSINQAVSGGTAPYTYAWNNSNVTTEDRTNLAAGTYSVAITDAKGCSISKSYTVYASSAITASAVVGNTCNGSSNGSINQTVSGGTSPYTYAWNGSSVTTQDRTNLAAGTYSVAITDAKGCSISKSYTVTQPSSAITISGVVTNVSCNGDDNGAINISVTGGAGSYTYNWGDNVNNTNNNNHGHNCHSRWSSWCYSHCNNNNSTGTSQDLSGVEAGTYTVTVTDANGCSKTATFTVAEPTAINAGISVNPTITVTGGQAYTIYKGYGPQSVNLTAAVNGGTAPYTYQWSGYGLSSTASSVTVSPTSTRTYTLTVTDAKGCTKTVTKTINVVDVRCNSNGNNVKITMCHNGHEICVDQSSVATHLNQGDYIGDCNGGGGCSKQTNTEEKSDVSTILGSADINVYPNPSNGNFTIELPADAQSSVIIITDVTGKVVEKKAVVDEKSVQFDMSGAASGTYMINVVHGGDSYKAKVSIR